MRVKYYQICDNSYQNQSLTETQTPNCRCTITHSRDESIGAICPIPRLITRFPLNNLNTKSLYKPDHHTLFQPAYTEYEMGSTIQSQSNFSHQYLEPCCCLGCTPYIDLNSNSSENLSRQTIGTLYKSRRLQSCSFVHYRGMSGRQIL